MLHTQAGCFTPSFFTFCNLSRFHSPGGTLSSTSCAEHCVSCKALRNTVSTERLLDHAQTFSVLHIPTICLSWRQNLGGKHFDYLSPRENVPRQHTCADLSPRTCDLYLYHIQVAVLLPIKSAKHYQIIMLSALAFSVQNRRAHITAPQVQNILRDVTGQVCSTRR